MSYDLYFFRLHPDATVEAINQFLSSDEYNKFIDEQDESDEDDEMGRNLLPDRFIDTTVDPENLQLILGAAWLLAASEDPEPDPGLVAFLRGETGPPDELADSIDELFEYGPEGNMVPVMPPYGDMLQDVLRGFAKMMSFLPDKRIVVFDPQLDKVLDATAFAASANSNQAADMWNKIKKQIFGE